MWLIRQWFAVGLALICSTGCGSSTPESGTGGSGAVAPTDNELAPVPSFLVIAPPEVPTGDLRARIEADSGMALEATDVLTRELQMTALSADGSAAIGTMSYSWTRMSPERSFDWQAGFRWTASMGAMPIGELPGSTQNSPLVLSADGTTVFGGGIDPLTGNSHLYRWTEARGQEDISGPSGLLHVAPAVVPGGLVSDNCVSANGRVALGVEFSSDFVSRKTMRWEEGSGWKELGPTTEDWTPQLSRDGQVALPSPTSQWSAQAGLRDLPTDCPAGSLSLDGVTMGACLATTSAYRVSREGQLTLLTAGDVRLGGVATSADGSVMFFAAYQGVAPLVVYYRWTQGTGLEELPELTPNASQDELSIVGAAEDGQTLFGNFYDEASPNWSAFEWSQEMGLQILEPPSGYEHSQLLTFSTDGSLASGFAFNGSLHEDIPFGEGGQSTKTGGQVVVWDALGPRLLSEELGALVPETMTWETERPLLITHTKSAIVVIGTSPSYGWRAVLPLR